jgi:hypothetical protein
VLWSLCLFYSANSLGTAYFERETVRGRLKLAHLLRVAAAATQRQHARRVGRDAASPAASRDARHLRP